MTKTTVHSSDIRDGTIIDADIATANKDGASGTASLRTLGTGAAQAAAGNDARLAESATHVADSSAAHAASAVGFTPNGSIAATDVQAAIQEVRDEAAGGGAPSTADYLVGTADGGLSGEIVVGTTPGGELGGTWAAPTVDALHGGSRHHIPTLLSSVKGSADTPDDEFSAASGAALDAKWTVVDGTNGAVTLNAAAGAGLYRQGQRAGWLMMQIGTAVGDSVVLRQDYTLPDGACIVAPVSCALDMAAAVANSEVAFGIGVNNNDTSVDAAGATLTAQVLFDADAGGARIIGWDSAAVVGQSFATQQVAVNDLFFFRIDRVGLVYHLFWSRDGYSWNYLGGKTLASAANNLWLFAECRATMANRIVVGCPWFRQGTALAVDPWTL